MQKQLQHERSGFLGNVGPLCVPAQCVVDRVPLVPTAVHRFCRKTGFQGLRCSCDHSAAFHRWESWGLFGNRRESLFSGKNGVDSIRILNFSGFLRAAFAQEFNNNVFGLRHRTDPVQRYCRSKTRRSSHGTSGRSVKKNASNRTTHCEAVKRRDVAGHVVRSSWIAGGRPTAFP